VDLRQRPRQPVTVAVVSWNTRQLLLRCLKSLDAEVQAGRASVYVVDNGSQDGSAEAARERGGAVTVIEPEENLGFGRAVNLVAARTQGDWLLVANADVALEPGALTAMLAAAEDPQVGCVAPRLLLPGGETQHSVHPFPTVGLTLAFNLGLHRLAPGLGERLCLEGRWDPERPRPVPWALGACLLLRRSAFDEVGGFDEDQWMYAEDLELGWRLHEHGWITRYAPAARVRHEHAASAEQAFGAARTATFLAATYTLLRRRRGVLIMVATAAINIFGAAARMVWMSPPALVSRAWRTSRAENRRWLLAHVQAVRSPSTLPRQS
jgi:N-acetylglucosaminyl-diphospho-decaprenol L-rhamnosyltransferase